MKYGLLLLINLLLFSTSYARKKVITPEQEKYLQAKEAEKIKLKNKKVKKKKSKNKKMYVPAPVVNKGKNLGFVVERDSAKIQKVKMTYHDRLNIKMCYSSGVSVILDENFQYTLQTANIDDKRFFDYHIFQKK